MWKEILLRFLVGGAVVSVFALLSDLFRPRRFAGLFGAAPSVALATLALTISRHGKMYAAVETRSMVAGAIAFTLYTFVVCKSVRRLQYSPLVATSALLVLWFSVAFGLWAVWLR